jgi:hypothetical protein
MPHAGIVLNYRRVDYLKSVSALRAFNLEAHFADEGPETIIREWIIFAADWSTPKDGCWAATLIAFHI